MSREHRIVLKHEAGDPPMQYLYFDEVLVCSDHRIPLSKALNALHVIGAIDFRYEYVPSVEDEEDEEEDVRCIVDTQAVLDADAECMDIIELTDVVEWQDAPVFDDVLD